MLLAAAAPTATSRKTDFPRRAVKFVVPVPPGNMLNSMPRIIGEKLSARWSQPVIVENRPGAASNLGTEAVFKSEPDGYTLLVSPPGPLAVSQHVYPKLGFDPTAFVPVSTLIQFPFILIVNAKAAGDELRGVHRARQGQPGQGQFGSPGVSSTPHLQMERFAAAAGIKFVHVPYPGLAPAMRDLLAGHIDAIFDTPGNVAAAHRQRRREGAGGDRHKAHPRTAERAGDRRDAARHRPHRLVRRGGAAEDAARDRDAAVAGDRRGDEAAGRGQADRRIHRHAVGGSPAETGALIKRESELYRALIAATGIKVEK